MAIYSFAGPGIPGRVTAAGECSLIADSSVGDSMVFEDRRKDDVKSIERVLKSRKHLRELSARLLNAHEEERRIVAHEVHENLAQTMIAVQYRVETALSEMEKVRNPKYMELLEPVTAILHEGIGSIRRIAGRLRPLMLDDLGILVTLSRLCDELEGDHPGLCIEKRLDIEEEVIPEALKVVIYRILESAFFGILKQGPAGLVEISLEMEGPVISLTIRDDGGGLDSEQILSGSEIRGWPYSASIGERAMLTGGVLKVASHEGGGTTLQVSWSVKEEPQVQ